PCADLDWAALIRGDRRWWFWMDDDDFAKTTERGRPMTIYDRWLHHVATPRSTYSTTPCDRKFHTAEVERLVAGAPNDPEPLLDLLTRGLAFNYGSPGDHITWWNYDKVRRFLADAGFIRVSRSAYGQSVSPLMRDLRH